MQKKTKKKASPKKTAVKQAPKKSAPDTFNIDEINRLLKAVKSSGVSELKLEKGNFKVTIRQGGQVVQVQQAAAPQQVMAAPAQAVPAPAAAPAAAEAAPAADDNLVTIKSPMIGTFYRSSTPDKPPFKNVGDSVNEGDVICIVEAMKLFNEIESEVSGKIVKVLVDDASPVEYDQPLFLVEP